MTPEERKKIIARLMVESNFEKQLTGRGAYRDTGREASGYGEAIDSLVGAPAREAISELQQGNVNLDALNRVISRIGADPEKSATGGQIADRALDPADHPYANALMATAVDAGAQLPIPGMTPGFAAGVKRTDKLPYKIAARDGELALESAVAKGGADLRSLDTVELMDPEMVAHLEKIGAERPAYLASLEAKKGYGSKALAALEKSAKKRGADSMYLNASPLGGTRGLSQKDAARKVREFYERNGYAVAEDQQTNAMMLKKLRAQAGPTGKLPLNMNAPQTEREGEVKKPKFNPNQPFEAADSAPAQASAKPKFDPSQPFEAAPEQSAKASGDWRDTELPLGTTPRGLIQGGLNALPTAGMLGGGVMGAAAGTAAAPGLGTVGGAVGGAGLGAAGGEALKNLGERYLLGQEKTRADIYGKPAMGLVEGATGEMGGAIIGKGISKAMDNAGKQIYKSGLKRIDEQTARFGKEPVSDLLMKEGVTGNAKQIFDKMQVLGDKLLAQRNDILKEATKKGAEVNVPKALAEAKAYVNQLKKTDNPELKKAVAMLEKRIAAYGRMGAKESHEVLRTLPKQGIVLPESQVQKLGPYTKPERTLVELPVQGEVAPGMTLADKSGEEIIDANLRTLKGPAQIVSKPPVQGSYVEPGGFTPGQYETVPERFISQHPEIYADEIARRAGPTPIQATKWKTTSANNVGKSGWKELSMSPEGKGFDKALSGGMRRGVEESVEQSLGPEYSKQLSQKNKELGQVLTSRERALMDAEQEARKNAFTSVDGMIAGVGNPVLLAVKKAADIAKMTGPRTKFGKGLMDLSRANSETKVLEGLIKTGLLPNSSTKKDIPQGLLELDRLQQGYEP